MATKAKETVGGVSINPVPITTGAKVEVKYNGLLAQSGADAVVMHVGYGSEHAWYRVQDIPMKRPRKGASFTTELEVDDPTRLNFCFTDNAGNWDNNSGNNWSYEIHNGDLATFQ